jgi:F0F1-type ATP synthase alpha subunit
MSWNQGELKTVLDETFALNERMLARYRPILSPQEVGTVYYVGHGIARVHGLPSVRAEELDAFARFGTRLDEATRQTLERGRRMREVLKQPQYAPMPVAEQLAVLLAVNDGVFDELSPTEVADAERAVRQAVVDQLPDLCLQLQAGDALDDEARQALIRVARDVVAVTYGEC